MIHSDCVAMFHRCTVVSIGALVVGSSLAINAAAMAASLVSAGYVSSLASERHRINLARPIFIIQSFGMGMI